MCINVASERPKELASLFFKKREKINDMKFKNYIKNRNKKILEEIKDKIIDKYREKIISQYKEIEELKRKLEEIMKASLYILKNSLNIDNVNNSNILTNTISLKAQNQKKQLKNDILNIRNKKVAVYIMNRNNNKNFNSSTTTYSNENNKLKKSNTLTNGFTVEYKKNKGENNLSLSNSRIKLNKYEAFSPKGIKIEKVKKNSMKIKTKKKEWDSPYKPFKNVYINDLNTYYLKELNKKDYQKIEEIKIKLQNNNTSECNNGLTYQKKNNNSNVYKYYSQNKNNKKDVKKNLVNKSNNYSYGKNNLKKIFNSPKSISTDFSNEYIISKERKTSPENNNIILNNNYLLTSPNFNGKNIIHRNININNNNNKIYINTDNNINNVYLQNVNHFKTQNNFYPNKVLKTDDNQISLKIKRNNDDFFQRI